MKVKKTRDCNHFLLGVFIFLLFISSIITFFINILLRGIAQKNYDIVFGVIITFFFLISNLYYFYQLHGQYLKFQFLNYFKK